MSEELKKEDRRVRRTKKLLTQALTELLQKKQINEITVTSSSPAPRNACPPFLKESTPFTAPAGTNSVSS